MNRKTKIALRLLALVVVGVGVWQIAPRVLEQQDLYFGKSVYQEETERRIASLPIQYMDSILCTQCHQDQHDEQLDGNHQTVACETCHGPGQAHIENNRQPLLDTSREACGVCHDQLDARPSDFPQIDLVQHNSQSACVTCHNPMGAVLQIPHPVEEGINCLFCHGDEDFKPLPESHVGRGDEACQVCHWANDQSALPANHEGRTNAMCQVCHQATLLLPTKMAHNPEGRANCATCHAATELVPLPESHSGRSQETCRLCHQEFVEPTQAPHLVSGRSSCINCHGSGVPLGDIPASHKDRTEQMCPVCHEGR